MNAFSSLYDKFRLNQQQQTIRSEYTRAASSESMLDDQSESWFREAESDPLCPTLVRPIYADAFMHRFHELKNE